jgi:hypothetical protein
MDRYIVIFGRNYNNLVIGELTFTNDGNYIYNDRHKSNDKGYRVSQMMKLVYVYPYDDALYHKYKNVKDPEILQLLFKKLKDKMLNRKQIEKKYGEQVHDT